MMKANADHPDGKPQELGRIKKDLELRQRATEHTPPPAQDSSRQRSRAKDRTIKHHRARKAAQPDKRLDDLV
jgi:hypothetical protein